MDGTAHGMHTDQTRQTRQTHSTHRNRGKEMPHIGMQHTSHIGMQYTSHVTQQVYMLQHTSKQICHHTYIRIKHNPRLTSTNTHAYGCSMVTDKHMTSCMNDFVHSRLCTQVTSFTQHMTCCIHPRPSRLTLNPYVSLNRSADPPARTRSDAMIRTGGFPFHVLASASICFLPSSDRAISFCPYTLPM